MTEQELIESTPGVTQPEIDHRMAWYDVVNQVGAGERRDSKDWRQFMPPFLWQQWMPKCTAMAARAIDFAVNKAFDKELPTITSSYLFFASGGGKNGNSIIAPLLYLKNNPVPFSDDIAELDPNFYSFNSWEKMKADGLIASSAALARGEAAKLAGVSQIAAMDLITAIDAMEYSPLSVAVPVYKGYFDAMNGWQEQANPPWHNVAVSKLFANGDMEVFDSLTVSSSFDGFHKLPADYTRSSFCSVRDLPSNWKEKQKSWLEQQFPFAYTGYGKPRLPLIDEQTIALELRKLIEDPRQDPRIRTLAGKYWIVLVSAATYGGYSYYVVQNGKKYFSYGANGSDLANLLYGFMRTGKWGMNLDRPRNQQ